MLMVHLLFAAALGYIVGSFPTSVLVTRLLNEPDLRSSGSGHTGGLSVKSHTLLVSVQDSRGITDSETLTFAIAPPSTFQVYLPLLRKSR